MKRLLSNKTKKTDLLFAIIFLSILYSVLIQHLDWHQFQFAESAINYENPEWLALKQDYTF